MNDLSAFYWLSAGLALLTLAAIAVALLVLERLDFLERVFLGGLGASVVLSMWMGLIPNGVVDNWPFLLGRICILGIMEKNYGPAVRKRLGAVWTFGSKIAGSSASDADIDAFAKGWASPVPTSPTPPRGVIRVAATEKADV